MQWLASGRGSTANASSSRSGCNCPSHSHSRGFVVFVVTALVAASYRPSSCSRKDDLTSLGNNLVAGKYTHRPFRAKQVIAGYT